MLLQVFFRYVLNASLSWSEELARLLFVWLTFLGFGLAAESNTLPAMTFVADRFGGRARVAVETIRDALQVSVALLMLYFGLRLAREIAGVPTPALQIPTAWFPLAVAAGGGLLSLEFALGIHRKRGGVPAAAAFALGGLFALGLSVMPHGLAPVGSFTIGAFVVLLVAGVPIALALAGAAFIGLANAGAANLDAIVRQLSEGVNSFLLLAIPFFMLAGGIMSSGGLAERLVAFARVLVGWMRGGLAQVDTLVSAIFADISGSAAGDAASVGGVLIPQMIEEGYPPAFAAAVQAAGGTLGLLFPPATALIVYSSVTNVPISALFRAAVLPGILVTLVFMAVNLFFARRLRLESGRAAGRKNASRILTSAILPLFTIVIIVGGILGGVFTPTESGVVAVAYAMVVAMAVLRTLRPRRLPAVLAAASVNTARVTSIIAGASAIGWLLALAGVPAAISNALLADVAHPLAGILLINVLFLIVHTAMEAAPSILVVMPVVLPAIGALHIDPIQLGITIVINCGIGMILPPLGILSFLTASIAEVGVGSVFRLVLPYAAALTVVLLLTALFPALSLR